MQGQLSIDQRIGLLRSQLKHLGDEALKLMDIYQAIAFQEGVNVKELNANTMLAYRHIEDAAMRLGKAIQAYEGGKSIYDNNDAARVAANGPVAPGSYATSDLGQQIGKSSQNE